MDGSGLSWQAWLTLGTVGLILGLLLFTRIGPDGVFIGGLTLLLTAGVLKPSEAFAGFSNEGMLTVAVLFVVAAGLRETGAVGAVAQRLLGRPRSVPEAQARLMVPVAFMSAWMNNTPLVAIMLPVVSEWARRSRISVSKLMIPLSYAAILGGVCTLIGTSTNLVVNGLLAQAGLPTFRLFDIAWVGIPCAVAGFLYILVFGHWLLPNRRPPISQFDDPREYTVEMLVPPDSPLIGRSIEEGGLRHLPGMYLMEIDREGQILAAVSPQERLRANDRLVFVGAVDSVVDLQKIPGLQPATDQVFKLDGPRSQRCLVEAVVSNSCPLVGQTIRDGRFRTLYHAAVIGVARNGERLRQKIGDIVLRAGDTLLLEARPSFVEQQRNSRDFYLVSQLEDSAPPRHDRAWVAVAILVGMILAATLTPLSMLNAALLAAVLMLITGCCTGIQARRSMDWQVLLTIAASFGIGRAMEETGAARVIAQSMLPLGAGHPHLMLAAIYGVTMLLTALLSNNAAAVLMFPIALATARSLQVSFSPFAVAVMMAASADFSTPIGYQTNLMVYGPGGYRFTDYLRIGGPLNLLVWILTTLIVPRVWSF